MCKKDQFYSNQIDDVRDKINKYTEYIYKYMLKNK